MMDRKRVKGLDDQTVHNSITTETVGGTRFDKTPLPLLDTAIDNAPVGVVFVVVWDYN